MRLKGNQINRAKLDRIKLASRDRVEYETRREKK